MIKILPKSIQSEPKNNLKMDQNCIKTEHFFENNETKSTKTLDEKVLKKENSSNDTEDLARNNMKM